MSANTGRSVLVKNRRSIASSSSVNVSRKYMSKRYKNQRQWLRGTPADLSAFKKARSFEPHPMNCAMEQFEDGKSPAD